MRMWNVPTEIMCRNHLLGEHLEMHMFVGAIKRKMNIQGFIENNLVDTSLLKKRHTQLIKEFKARGYNHKSKLLPFSIRKMGKVHIEDNIKELARRCKECRKKINHSFSDRARF